VHQARVFGVEGFERDVALKLVREPRLAGDPRFHAALKSALELSHAGVLQLVDSDSATIDGVERLFFVTELARGERLTDVLQGAPKSPALLRIVSSVARVLDYAHRRKRGPVAHGRLHVGQIFVHRGDVRVADFCVARATGGSTDASVSGDLAALARLLKSLPLGVPDDRFTELCAALLEGTTTAQHAAEVLLALAVEREVDASPLPSPVRAQLEAISLKLAEDAAAEELDLARGSQPGEDPPPAAPSTDGAGNTSVRRDEPSSSAAPPVDPSHEAATSPQEVDVESASTAHPLPPVSAPATAPKPRPVGRFVGRSEELMELGMEVARVVEDGARWLHLRGPEGIGKTRLARELLRRLPRDKVQVEEVGLSDAPTPAPDLAGSGLAGSWLAAALRTLLELPPRGTFDVLRLVSSLRAVGLVRADIAALISVLGVNVDSDDPPQALSRALLKLVGALGGGRPILLVFDDADLMDATSRRVLEECLDEESAALVPWLIVTVERQGANREAGRERVMAVEELCDADLAQLISARLGARIIEPELFEGVAQAVGGHPAYVEEYLRELGTLTLLDVRGGVASLHADAELPTGARQLALRRIAALKPTARRALDVVVASGGAARLDSVRAVLGSDGEAAVLELSRAGLARVDAAGRVHVARIHHPSEPIDPALHASLARHLLEIDRVASAEHFEQAGLGEDAAAAWYRAALETAGDSPMAALDAASRALRGPSLGSVLAERLALVAKLLPSARELPPVLAENLGGALEQIDGASPEVAADIRMHLVDGMIEAGAFELALILQDQAVSIDPSLSAAAAKKRALVAVRAASPRLAPEADVELEQDDAAQLLDVAELALLRGDRERVRQLLSRAPAGLTLAERVRHGRLGLRIEESVDGRQVDALTALAQALRPHREVAEVFLAAADALEGERARARKVSLLQEAARFAEEASHERCRTVATVELSMLVRGRAAMDAALAAASRLRAAGDVCGALDVRARVARSVGTDLDSLREEARSLDLAGIVP
jgi:hypothetical protein